MLYLDASALVKRYIDEDDSSVVREAMDGADAWSTCRLCFVETIRAVGLATGRKGINRVKGDWGWFEVIDIDQALAAQAAELAVSHRLRSLDALHLAAAMAVRDGELTLATWDRRLHAAAGEQGLAVLPATL